jgi:hypothetical protein
MVEGGLHLLVRLLRDSAQKLPHSPPDAHWSALSGARSGSILALGSGPQSVQRESVQSATVRSVQTQPQYPYGGAESVRIRLAFRTRAVAVAVAVAVCVL